MSELRLISIEQGSPEWHAVRREHRPASMSPWVTKASRYSGIKDALAFFKKEERPIDPFLQRLWDHGKAMEPIAATELEEHLRIGGEPAVGVRGKYLASMDFYSPREGLGAEIKCPYQGTVSKTWKYAENGEIDPGYIDQLETQWRVFGLRRHGLFVYINARQNIWVPFAHSDERWERIERAWDEFEIILANGVDPDAPVKIEDGGALALAETYRELQERIKALEVNATEIKKQLEEKAAGKTALFGEVLSVRYETRAGSIDYATLVREHCPSVDVEAYRGDPTPYYKVAISKAKTEPAAPAEAKPRKRGK